MAGLSVRAEAAFVAATTRRHVLVVDDSALQRKLLVNVLRNGNYQITEAPSAEEAMEVCRENHPDIILSDWMMPGMSGPEFCRMFREELWSSYYTYFILLTSKSDSSEIAEGLDAGADDFLTKPVDRHELMARIHAGERILDMQARLNDQNKALAEALQEVERLNDALDNDLREARQLQQSLLPERHRKFEACEISLLLKSSGYVGGDLVGCYPAGPHHVGMYAIDVSGHGISAALMTARLAGFLSPVAPDQNVALRKKQDGSYAPIAPAKALENLNRLVLDEMETEHYFTIILCDLDQRSGVVRMGQAGHPHPLIHRADGTLTQDSPGGFPVGLMPDVTFSQFETTLNPGDRLLLHSDGFTECPGPGGVMLGEAGLEKIAQECHNMPGLEYLETLTWRLADFAGGSSFPDDISAVLLDYTGQSPK